MGGGLKGRESDASLFSWGRTFFSESLHQLGKRDLDDLVVVLYLQSEKVFSDCSINEKKAILEAWVEVSEDFTASIIAYLLIVLLGGDEHRNYRSKLLVQIGDRISSSAARENFEDALEDETMS